MRVGVAAIVLLWMGTLSCYDVRRRRLPNWLTLPGAAAILAAATVLGRGGPALAGAAALAGMYLIVHLASPHAMGAGDVKLAVGLGGLTGACGVAVWVLAALAAPAVTLAVAAGCRARTVPHGPSMTLATAVVSGLAVFR